MRLAIAAVVLSACGGGDRVTARFEVDDPAATSVRMVVYAEGDVTLSCDTLAFSEIAEQDLAQATVVEVSGARGERVELGEIPRDGLKLFFAEAFTDNGTPIYAGCAPLGAIDGDVEVDIPVEERLQFVPTGLEITGGELRVNRLATTNIEGQRVDGEIRYSIVGPAEFETGGSLEQGEPVTVTSTLPPQPGPLRLQLRARWAEPEELNTVQEPAVIPLDLNGQTTNPFVVQPLQVGQLGGAVGVVALTGLAGQKTAQRFCFTPGTFNNTRSPQAMPDVGVLATVRDPGGGKLVGASQDTLFELSCDADVAQTAIGLSRPPTRAVTLPSCDPAEADPAVYVQDAMGMVAVDPEDGSPITSFSGSAVIDPEPLAATNTQLVTAGCVDAATETLPTMVLAQSRTGGLVTALLATKTGVGTEDEASRFQFVTAQVTAGSAFPATNTGSGGLQLGLVTDEGPAIGHYDIQLLGANMLAIDEVANDPTPSVVTDLASGDVDGDDLNDVVALLSFGDNVQVFISLARPGTDDRLRGFFPGPIAGRSTSLRVFDVNGDGVDDIVLLGETELVVLDMGG